MMFWFTYDIIFVQFLKSKFQASRSNVTAIRGETAMLVCKVINMGDKVVVEDDNHPRESKQFQ